MSVTAQAVILWEGIMGLQIHSGSNYVQWHCVYPKGPRMFDRCKGRTGRPLVFLNIYIGYLLTPSVTTD